VAGLPGGVPVLAAHVHSMAWHRARCGVPSYFVTLQFVTAEIRWYNWVLNKVLNKGRQMCEMWLCVVPHRCCLAACVFA